VFLGWGERAGGGVWVLGWLVVWWFVQSCGCGVVSAGTRLLVGGGVLCWGVRWGWVFWSFCGFGWGLVGGLVFGGGVRRFCVARCGGALEWLGGYDFVLRCG